MMTNQTVEQLLALHLPAMAGEYRRQREMPAIDSLDFDTRLGMIADAEWVARNNQRSQKLIKEAGLCASNALFGDLDYQPARKLNKAQVARLSDFAWSREAKNIIITGATGTGKSYLACAFGAEACRMGIRVKYHRTSLLFTELCAAYSDNRLNDILRRLNKADILILDDWGLSSINTLQARALLEVFENRIGAKSCVIAAQPPVAKWFELFEDATIADAIMDRLVYSSYRFELHGPSMRRRYGLRAEEEVVIEESDGIGTALI